MHESTMRYASQPQAVSERGEATSRRPRLANVSEVAAELGVSTHWVYRAAKGLGMPCHRLGRYVRFDMDEVIHWVKSGLADVS